MSQKKAKENKKQSEKIKELKKDIISKAKARKQAIWITAFFVTIAIILSEAFILKIVLKLFGSDVGFFKLIIAVGIANFMFSFIKVISKNGKKSKK